MLNDHRATNSENNRVSDTCVSTTKERFSYYVKVQIKIYGKVQRTRGHKVYFQWGWGGGGNSLLFIFAFYLINGQLLKKRMFSYGKNFALLAANSLRMILNCFIV